VRLDPKAPLDRVRLVDERQPRPLLHDEQYAPCARVASE
jgi:hypothetical protein